VENCADVSEGECILLCQDSGGRSKASSEGVNRIVAMDDNLLWTASSSSNVLRWRVPQRRSIRASALTIDNDLERLGFDSPAAAMSKRYATAAAEGSTPPRSPESITRPSTSASDRTPHDSFSFTATLHVSGQGKDEEAMLCGIPYHSLVRLTSPNDPFTPYTLAKGRDAEVATLYSAASVLSVPHPPTQPQQALHPPNTSPMRISRTEESGRHINTARADYEERELAAHAIPLCSGPDDIIEGEHGLVRSVILNDRIHALTVDTSGEVAVWDIVRAVCRGKYTPEEVASASHRGSTFGGVGGDMERSPREALEAVRERIEGEAVVLPWSSVDTKTGVLTVYLNERCFEAEIYADEVGFGHDRQVNDETRCAFVSVFLSCTLFGSLTFSK
jgi:WD repeat-containing protein 48